MPQHRSTLYLPKLYPDQARREQYRVHGIPPLANPDLETMGCGLHWPDPKSHRPFNIASQNDNRTNIDIAATSKQIAEDSRRIAEEAKKDSSSMITIAAVTMLFLPGTFVSVSTPVALNNGAA